MGQKDEPSMEEILSSIKRIIAEEGDAPPQRRTQPAAHEDPEVLELTHSLAESEPGPISAEEAPAIMMAPVAPPPPHLAPVDPDALLSAATADATRQALASLSRVIVKPEDAAADNTLEGLVRELLRPMLKEWLDENLPRIVQATVDREVARISGRPV